MIALLDGGRYFISDYADNINDLLIDYASYIGAIDMRVFKILVNSNEMSTDELIEYINKEEVKGKEVTLKVERDNKTKNIKVTPKLNSENKCTKQLKK